MSNPTRFPIDIEIQAIFFKKYYIKIYISLNGQTVYKIHWHNKRYVDDFISRKNWMTTEPSSESWVD